MGELAEQTTDGEVALTHTPGLSFANRLVISGANADPGRQTIRTAESLHIGVNFDEQHSGTDPIDVGDRLQQGQEIAFGFHRPTDDHRSKRCGPQTPRCGASVRREQNDDRP